MVSYINELYVTFDNVTSEDHSSYEKRPLGEGKIIGRLHDWETNEGQTFSASSPTSLGSLCYDTGHTVRLENNEQQSSTDEVHEYLSPSAIS